MIKSALFLAIFLLFVVSIAYAAIDFSQVFYDFFFQNQPQPSCIVGDKKCVSNDIYECDGADYNTYISTCESPQECFQSENYAYCDYPQTERFYCYGNYDCEHQYGQGYQCNLETSECYYAGTAEVCNAGEQKCIGNSIWECDFNGAYTIPVATCSENEQCAESGNYAYCEPTQRSYAPESYCQIDADCEQYGQGWLCDLSAYKCYYGIKQQSEETYCYSDLECIEKYGEEWACDLETYRCENIYGQIELGKTSFSEKCRLTNTDTISREEFRNFILRNVPANSVLRNEEDAIYDASVNAGVNPAFVLAIAGLESAWGTSELAQCKLNLFEWGAEKKCDGRHCLSDERGCAIRFSTLREGIETVSGSIYDGWLSPNPRYPPQRVNLDQISGLTPKRNRWKFYAEDDKWPGKIAEIMGEILGTSCDPKAKPNIQASEPRKSQSIPLRTSGKGVDIVFVPINYESSEDGVFRFEALLRLDVFRRIGPQGCLPNVAFVEAGKCDLCPYYIESADYCLKHHHLKMVESSMPDF